MPDAHNRTRSGLRHRLCDPRPRICRKFSSDALHRLWRSDLGEAAFGPPLSCLGPGQGALEPCSMPQIICVFWILLAGMNAKDVHSEKQIRLSALQMECAP